MQNNRPFSPNSNPQRPGILPPLSKYYYGPAVSPDRSPANDAGWNAPNPQQSTPSLPSHHPPDPASVPSLSQWSLLQNGASQPIRLPGPPPTAPPARQVAQSSYNPNTYGPMSQARLSPINSTWNQSSHSIGNADTSKWGVNYNQGNAPKPPSELKPPLPPRNPSSQSQYHGSSPDNEALGVRESGSFEYLRPVAYSPIPSPSISQNFAIPPDENLHSTSVQSVPQRLPPPPPRKVPIHHENHQDQESYAPPNQQRDRRDSIKVTGQLAGLNIPVAEDNIIQPDQGLGTALAAKNVIQDRQSSSTAQHGMSAQERKGFDSSEQEFETGKSDTSTQGHHNERFLETSPKHASILHKLPDDGRATSSDSNRAQGDDSFYWHSPHSSASISHSHDPNQDIPGTSSLLDASLEPQSRHISTLPADQELSKSSEQSTSLYRSNIGPYSASALGFGGPSDWEHFGDYDGEEVDDTDLYIRPKSPDKSGIPTDTSELPGDTALVNEQLTEHPPFHEDASGISPEVQPCLLESVQSTGHQANEIHDNGILNQHSDENPSDVVQSTASDQQVSTSNSIVEQESSVQQQSPTSWTPQSFLPQFPFEQKPQGPEEPLQNAVGGRLVHSRSTLVEIPSRVESAGAAEDHDDNNGVSITAVVLEDTPDIEDTPPDEPRKPKLDCQTHDAVEQSIPTESESQPESRLQSLAEKGSSPSEEDQNLSEGVIKPESTVSEGIATSNMKELGDSYADLDSWGKASLNRYIAMLHGEARASTEKEKLDRFKTFIKKEWKLRVVLYGADDDGNSLPLEGTASPVSRRSTLTFRRPASKALPALPSDADQPKNLADNANADSRVPLNLHRQSLTSLRATKADGSALLPPAGDSNVLIDTPGGHTQQAEEDAFESYSPGGRPIRPQVKSVDKPVVPSDLKPQSGNTAISHSYARETEVPDNQAAYTPFRYSQGYVDEANQPVDRRASFRPYAALKLEPIEHRPDSAPEPVAKIPHDRALNTDHHRDFGPASPKQFQSIPKRDPALARAQLSSTTEDGPPLDLRRFERADFDPLIAVLPRSGLIPQNAVDLSDIHHGVNAVPDDFSFIHQHVVDWDTKAKKLRTDNERERQIRQGESEQRIDALFNDDEIGYGDISELESEFKRAEAARKTEEDRAEYQSFVEVVFNAVWTRLHFEIDQLSPLYNQYSSLAHETLAGKDMFEAEEGQYALASTMSALLTLHQKLEIRHQKAFEAVLERDRRLKRTEVATFYTLGNVGKVKLLEKQFESAERKAIAEYCKQRNTRANRLMDVLDQNTLRGVGANQDYMEAVMKAVRRIASGRAFASAPASEPGLGMDEAIKAQTVTAVLAGSSEQIVQTFHVADMLLNAADYELSVAMARLADADPTTFDRLKEERGKEDAKLMRDLQHRLTLIREDSRRTNDEIVKLLCFLGVQGGHQEGNMSKSQPTPDSDHEQRLQMALEDAKRRNAQKREGEPLPGTP